MSLRSLISNQTVTIDDHFRGTGEVKTFDGQFKDVHLEKHTKAKVDGKKRKVVIKLPLNSDRGYTLEIKGKTGLDIPRELLKEIKHALMDDNVVKALTNDLFEILTNYGSTLNDIEKVGYALDKIAKHFDISWDGQQIVNTKDGRNIEVMRIYYDENNNEYYIKMNEQKIVISDGDYWSRRNKRFGR